MRTEGRPPSIWYAETVQHDTLVGRLRSISDDERVCARGFRSAADRDRYITGRLLLRLALSAAVAGRVQPSAWRFAFDRLSKPRVAPQLPQLNFNLAHAGRMAVVAVDAAGPVGVDVERIDGAPFDLPALVLSAREKSTLDRCAPEMRHREFLKLWTLKEALAKRSGEGIGLNLAAVEPDWQVGAPAQRIAMPNATLETRTIGMPDGAYQVSVALARDARELAWNRVDLLVGQLQPDL
jgi:4'-phosphopantetheinyl transferase